MFVNPSALFLRINFQNRPTFVNDVDTENEEWKGSRCKHGVRSGVLSLENTLNPDCSTPECQGRALKGTTKKRNPISKALDQVRALKEKLTRTHAHLLQVSYFIFRIKMKLSSKKG